MAEPPVVNASPLIILARGGRLDLLHRLHEHIVMPDAVAREVRRRAPDDSAVAALNRSEWIEIAAVGPAPHYLQRRALGTGETAVLTWAQQHPGAIAVLDDQKARWVAAELAIPVVGTLGVVLAAKRAGIIPSARDVVESLLAATGWYLSPTVLNAALARVGE